MKKMKKIIVIIVIVILFLAGLYLLIKNNRGGIEAKTSKVIRGKLKVLVSATGTVRSNKEAKLTTLSSGRINKIFVKENQFVKKGSLLLKLDSTEQSAKDYKRMVELSKKGFATSQQLELAREQWKNTFISAPFSGTIVKKFVEVGETLIGGTPAFLIADLDDLIVETNIDETDIGNVKIGEEAEVILDAYKNTKVQGTVQFIARSSLELKEKGITYLVKIKLYPVDVVLRLGMTGDVYIHIVEKNNVLMVPYTAIIEDDKNRFVFVVMKKGTLQKIVVKTGLENYEYTEIISGLDENDIIVSSDISKLKEGQKIKISSK